jgi:hypothetical protein
MREGANVRTVLGPKRLIDLAVAAEWQLESETLVQGGEGLLDGQWEVSACLSSSFQKEVEVLGFRHSSAAWVSAANT